MEALFGSIFTVLLACLAYFLNRLITQNDTFQKNTKKEFDVVHDQLRNIKDDYGKTKQTLNKIQLNTPTINLEKTINHIKDKTTEIKLDIKPLKSRVDKNYGEVRWLKGEIETQEKKILGLYKTLKKVIK